MSREIEAIELKKIILIADINIENDKKTQKLMLCVFVQNEWCEITNRDLNPLSILGGFGSDTSLKIIKIEDEEILKRLKKYEEGETNES